jgi:hypothetical protein
MVELGLSLLALVAAAGLLVALPRRRRAPGALTARVDRRPPGVKALASRVSELSDLGLHLPAASRAAAQKPRLGALLGLR